MAASLRRREPKVGDDVLEREKQKAFRSPLIVIVAAKIRLDRRKIPEIEQVISAGAATQSMILAFHAYGFASMWRTGQMAYDPEVKKAFMLEPSDHIVGVIYVGTALSLTDEKTRPNPNQFVDVWGQQD